MIEGHLLGPNVAATIDTEDHNPDIGGLYLRYGVHHPIRVVLKADRGGGAITELQAHLSVRVQIRARGRVSRRVRVTNLVYQIGLITPVEWRVEKNFLAGSKQQISSN